MNTLTPEISEADQTMSNAEMVAFKTYLIDRFNALPPSDNRSHQIGLILGAVGHIVGDFIGYTMENPEVTLTSMERLMAQSALFGKMSRIVEDHPVDSAP